MVTSKINVLRSVAISGNKKYSYIPGYGIEIFLHYEITRNILELHSIAITGDNLLCCSIVITDKINVLHSVAISGNKKYCCITQYC